MHPPAPPPLERAGVAIVGLGLLGGSLGSALHGRCARRIGVVEPGDEQNAAAACAAGIVDDVLELDEAVAVADMVLLCTPVATVLDLLPRVAAAARPGAVVTDVGSTKAAIVQAMRDAGGEAQFLGGHPMCGGTTAGLSAIDPEMFRGAPWALCPVEPDAAQEPSLVLELLQAVGAVPVRIGADEHDRTVAVTSHLPYALAQALVHLHQERVAGDTRAAQLAGRGWSGATRLAAGDVAMWRDVLVTNREHLTDAIAALVAQLQQLARVLDQDADGSSELQAWLERGFPHRTG